MRKYTTIQGDIWDVIALKTLGDEKYLSLLIMENAEYAEVAIFPAGVELKIPEIEEEYQAVKLPPWKE